MYKTGLKRSLRNIFVTALSPRHISTHPFLMLIETKQEQSSTTRLTALRKLMAEKGLHAYFVPSEDAHQVEWTDTLYEFFIRMNTLPNGMQGAHLFLDLLDQQGLQS